MVHHETSHLRRVLPWPGALPSAWSVAAVSLALLLVLPMLAVLSSFLVPAGAVWRHLWQTQLVTLLANTIALVLGVGVGTLFIGTSMAWLVVYYRFPGHKLLEWALILPLAMPAYVIGFVFLGLCEYTGPLQTLLRSVWGSGVQLPTLRSYGGITLLMTLVFYPYVYLLARAAFQHQGAATLETARSLGRSPLWTFVHLTVPMTRPALVAGVALAMMETLADFGTVSTFGYRTLTEAIYRVWYGMFDRTAAMQLASMLLVFALLLLRLERASRGHARFTTAYRRGTALTPTLLHGWRAWLAMGACLAVLAPGFLIPVVQLSLWAYGAVQTGQIAADFGTLLYHTMWLAGCAAACVCLAAVLLAYAQRLQTTSVVHLTTQLAAMGYALPGSVIAVGVLVPLAWADHHLVPWLSPLLVQPQGLLLTGSAVSLVFAYGVRFLAVGLQTVEAGLTKIPASLDDAARSLGVGTGPTLRRVHFPLLRGPLCSALILVFVETMKELPATLLLRPFGLNTLATEIWQRTSESMWQEAALPALAIVVAGVLPVLLAVRLSSTR